MWTQIQFSFSWLSPKEWTLGCILEPDTDFFMTHRCIQDARCWDGLISLRFKFHYKQLPSLWLTRNKLLCQWFWLRTCFRLEDATFTRLERTILLQCILLFWSCSKNRWKRLFLKVDRSSWLLFFHHCIQSCMNGCCSWIKKTRWRFFHKSPKNKERITWCEVN